MKSSIFGWDKSIDLRPKYSNVKYVVQETVDGEVKKILTGLIEYELDWKIFHFVLSN